MVSSSSLSQNMLQGSSGGFFNPGSTGLPVSSLAGINCAGPCTENYGGKHSCDVPGSNPNNFFCSPNVPLVRQQLTSHNKLWCTSACNKGSGDDFYECKYEIDKIVVRVLTCLSIQDTVWLRPLQSPGRQISKWKDVFQPLPARLFK